MKHFGTIYPYVFRLLAWNKKIKMNHVLNRVNVFQKKMAHLSRSFGVSKWKFRGLFSENPTMGLLPVDKQHLSLSLSSTRTCLLWQAPRVEDVA